MKKLLILVLFGCTNAGWQENTANTAKTVYLKDIGIYALDGATTVGAAYSQLIAFSAIETVFQAHCKCLKIVGFTDLLPSVIDRNFHYISPFLIGAAISKMDSPYLPKGKDIAVFALIHLCFNHFTKKLYDAGIDKISLYIDWRKRQDYMHDKSIQTQDEANESTPSIDDEVSTVEEEPVILDNVPAEQQVEEE